LTLKLYIFYHTKNYCQGINNTYIINHIGDKNEFKRNACYNGQASRRNLTIDQKPSLKDNIIKTLNEAYEKQDGKLKLIPKPNHWRFIIQPNDIGCNIIIQF